jgi:mitochondrial import receptor subunit TOM40
MVCHYLQSVTKRVALGTELAYQYGPAVPGFHATVMNVAGRYSCDDFTASGTIGSSGIHACYYQKCSNTLQVILFLGNFGNP